MVLAEALLEDQIIVWWRNLGWGLKSDIVSKGKIENTTVPIMKNLERN